MELGLIETRLNIQGSEVQGLSIYLLYIQLSEALGIAKNYG